MIRCPSSAADIDACRIELLNPPSHGPFTTSAVAHDVIEGDPDEQQMNGMKSPYRLAVRRAVHRQFDLLDRAVFRIRKLTGTADPEV